MAHTETSASPSLSTANSTSDPSARHSGSVENSATGGQEPSEGESFFCGDNIGQCMDVFLLCSSPPASPS